MPNEKLSKDDKLLLAFDALTLCAALGKAPLFGKIMHGAQQSIVKVKLGELIKVARTVVEKITTQKASNEPPQLVLNRHCAECEFKPRCRQMALEKGELSLLPRMSKVERKKLHERGIFSIHQLSYTFRPRRKPKRLASNPNKYFYALKALAIREQKIHILGRPELDSGGTKIFLDVEGVPDRDFYYLIGLRIRSGDSCVRYSFWANDLTNEKEIWVSLVNLLVETKSSQLVYYGSYEAMFLKRMKQRYAESIGNPITLDRLTKDSVNVLQVIYPHIYFPTCSNSLKEIAQHLGFRWSDSTPSGLSSLIWRSKWELTRDPGLKERLITYNAEDCEALETVFDAIVQLLQRHDDGVKTSADSVVHVESLRNDDFHRFGRIQFSLPELDYINRAAYWDYQRSKIYVRSNQRLKRIFRHTSTRPIRRPRPNKIVECHSLRPPTCPRCHAETIYKYGKLSKTVYDLKFGPGCCTRLRSIFSEGASLSRPLYVEDLRSGKHRLLIDCTVEAQGLRSHVHALEWVSPRPHRKHSGYIPKGILNQACYEFFFRDHFLRRPYQQVHRRYDFAHICTVEIKRSSPELLVASTVKRGFV